MFSYLKGGDKMRRLLKKKVNLFGKEISAVVVGLFAIALVSAALIPYYLQINQSVTITQGVSFTAPEGIICTGGFCEDPVTLSACESNTTGIYAISSSANVIVPLAISTLVIDAEPGLTANTEFVLVTEGSPGDGDESKVYIDAKDTLVSTLGDLDTISWDTYVSAGYITHVDVLIDTDGDGEKDDALVFEYDKVTNIGPTPLVVDMNYTRDEWMNTFGDRGSIELNSYAWLSSGCSGGVGGIYFTTDTLTNWRTRKLGNSYACNGTVIKTYDIDENTQIIGFDIEVDNWISTTDNPNSKVKNIMINGQGVEPSIKPGDTLSFDVFREASCLAISGPYTIVTEITTR